MSMDRIQNPGREFYVPLAVAIDLDRHVLDTELFHTQVLRATQEETGLDPAVVEAVRAERRKQKIVFKSDLEIRALLGDESGTQINRIFARTLRLCENPEVKDALYLPGAKKFITDLEIHGAFERGEAFFFTHGTDPLQILKLIATDLNNHPYLTTEEERKVTVLSNSVNDKGVMELPMTAGNITIFAERILYLDDSLISYSGMTGNIQGRLKPSPEKPLTAEERANIPPGVEIVDCFPHVTSNMGRIAISY